MIKKVSMLVDCVVMVKGSNTGRGWKRYKRYLVLAVHEADVIDIPISHAKYRELIAAGIVDA